MSDKQITASKAILTVNMTGFKRNLMRCVETGQVLYVIGNPGGGKTQGVYQAGAEAGFAVVDRVMSQYAPEDVGGFPVPDDVTGRVKRFMSDLLADIHDEKEKTGKDVLVFLDELNMAAPLVLAACFKMIHEGKAGSHEVPEGTKFAVAGNDPETNMLAADLPAPLINRMSMIVYNYPDWKEWSEWALAQSVHPTVYGFLSENQQFLGKKADFTASEPTPTARSLMAASETLDWCDKNKSASGERMTMLASTVGAACAKSMEAYVKYASELVPVAECMADPDNARTPSTNTVLSYMQAVAMIGACNTKDDVAKASTYVLRLPDEVHSVFAIGISNSAKGLSLRTSLPLELKKKVANTNQIANELDIGGEHNTASAA